MKNSTIPKNIPAKWVLAILALAIVYGLIQPALNKRFGLQLPSIGDLASAGPEENGKSAGRSSKGASGQNSVSRDLNEPAGQSDSDRPVVAASPARIELQSKHAASGGTIAESAGTTNSDPLDYLETIGNQTYRSPQGLIYKRGSAEGHRLKHLERHLKNDVNRPGPHGVFDGNMVEFLKKIDDAYQRAERKDRGTKMYDDDARTIYEASFEETIGYLGGQEGKRRNNPKLKRIRLVLNGESVITAFPF